MAGLLIGGHPADQKTAKAWVNCQGDDSAVLHADFNVSTVTHNSAGDMTINFSTAMATDDYVVATHANNSTGTYVPYIFSSSSGSAQSTTSFGIETNYQYSTTRINIDRWSAIFFE